MRILIYSYNYHPEPIGIAPLMTELAEGLVKRGHEVRVITAMPNYPERKIYPAYRGQWFMTEEKKWRDDPTLLCMDQAQPRIVYSAAARG